MEKYVPIEIRGREPLEVMELDSQHAPEDSILFTYYIKTQSDLVETAKTIAEEETTGRWIGSDTPTQTFYSAQADVCRIEKYGEGEGVIYVRSPLGNLDMESDLFYQIAMLSVGGPILEFVYYESVAYLDFQLPQTVLDKFPGPKFGIQGTREFIGLEQAFTAHALHQIRVFETQKTQHVFDSCPLAHRNRSLRRSEGSNVESDSTARFASSSRWRGTRISSAMSRSPRAPPFGSAMPLPRSRKVRPLSVPGGTVTRARPSSVGTSIVAPRMASRPGRGALTWRSRPSRRKTGWGCVRITA